MAGQNNGTDVNRGLRARSIRAVQELMALKVKVTSVGTENDTSWTSLTNSLDI